MDPSRFTHVNWSDTASILHSIWLIVIFVILFAAVMVMTHAIIPSALETGHVPEGVRNFVRKQRLPMYLMAIALLGAVAFWFYEATNAAHEIRRFWPRDWI